MVNMITSLFRKASRVLKEKGLESLFQKTRKKIKLILITLQKLPDATADSRVTAKEAQSLQEKTADWLRGNRKSFNNQFYVLLNYLLSFNKQLKSISPVACEDYKNHFKQNGYIGNLPFEITFPDVKEKENIIEFINDFDRIYLDRMIYSVFIRLIRFMVQQREEINLLDFGAGSLCGMYGENGRFLFEAGNINIDSVNFYAIDDIHKPQGSFLKRLHTKSAIFYLLTLTSNLIS